METLDSAIEEIKVEDRGTGTEMVKAYRIITYPFGRYEIKVKLDEENRFVAITEIKINTDFQNYQQKMPKGYHDVNEYYE